ncbi:MAG: ABC transporter substrate-binding protein, partial [Vicingaceae bacterium]
TSLALFIGCQPEVTRENSNTINIRQSDDASGINPLTIRDPFSNYLSMQIFQTLVGVDFKSKEVVGILAKEKGEITALDSNNIQISFEIRPQAKFDDGRSITAKDVVFSTKLHLLKGIKSYTSKFFDFVQDVRIDSTNPNKLYFIASNQQSHADYYCGSIYLMDEEVYDPKYLLRSYSIPAIKTDSTYQNENIQDLVTTLNDNKFAKNPTFIKGSGTYKIDTWNEGKNIRLVKKDKWWGEELNQLNSFFTAHAPALNYAIINDENTAIVSLKNKRVDLISGISPRQFNLLQKDEGFKDEFNLTTAEKMGYHCLGFNLNHPALKDLSIRKAIAHCLNTELFIEKVLYGLAKQTNGPLSPWREETYDKSIQALPYDLEKAKEALNNSEWMKNNSSIELEYAFNAGNKEREALGLILKEEAAKVGIKIRLTAYEWSVYLQKLKNGELQLFYSAVSSSLLPPNYSSSFHSTAAEGGRNYFNYKSEKADSLIDAMNSSKSTVEYNRISKAFQQLLQKDLPCIFLYSEKETFAFSKSIEDFYPSTARPHYWAPALSKH